MGMSHAGEITRLAKLAEPDCGVVTMVAPVHLEFFESIAGIARAKYELIESLPRRRHRVLNADDEYVSQFGRDFHGRVVTFGRHASADVSAQNVESRGPEGSAFDIVVDGKRAHAGSAAAGRAQHLQRAGGSCGRAAIRGPAAGRGRVAGYVISW